MKLLELRLLAFGPFSDLTLDFSEPDPALHVIYGSNEAGKSTTLRAVRGLLYGISQTSPDAHRHAGKELRIGGRLRRQDGRVLEFVRRKGRKATLLATDGTVLDEAVLAPFLEGVTESAFSTMFGLDHESLRAGAQAILEGKGEIGESLFSASLGGRGVHRVLSELREEAEELFTPRSRAKAINQTTAELREAKRLIEIQSASGASYRKQTEELERSRREREALRARWLELMAEHARLERARRVLPDLARRAAIVDELRTLSDVVLLPEDAMERRVRALRDEEDAAREVARIEEEGAEIERQLHALDIPESLVSVDEVAVKHVRDALGSHHKAQIDLPKRRAELGVIEHEIERGLRALRLPVAATEIERLRPSYAAAAAVRALSGQYGKLAADTAHARRALSAVQTRRTHQAERLRALPPPRPTDALERALAGARRAGDIDERFRRQRARRAALRDEIERRIMTLAPWTGPPAALPSLAVPSVESLDRLESRSEALLREEKRLRTDLGRLGQHARELARRIEEVTAQGSIPSEAELLVRRASRDERWSALREQLGCDERPELSALDEYETSVRDVDDWSDRLRREADRAARLASLVAERRAIESEAEVVNGDLLHAQNEIAAIEAQWVDLWRHLAFLPGSYSEMRAWRTRYAEVVQSVSELEQLERADAEIAARLWQLVSELSTALDRSVPEDHAAAYPILVDFAERSLADHAAVESERRSVVRTLAELDVEIAVLERDLSTREVELQRWKEDFERAVRDLGLDGECSPEQALAMLDALKELFSRADDAADLRRRVAGMERDSQKLAETVDELRRRHLPELVALPWPEAAEALVRRYDRAQQALDHRRSLREQLEGKRLRAETMRRKSNDARRELSQLVRAARVDTLEALERGEMRSGQARQLLQQRDEVEQRLRDAGEGASIEELLEQTRGMDTDTARARLAGIEPELKDLYEQLDSVTASIGRAEHGLLHFEGTEAANTALEAQLVTSRLRGQVQRYIRLKLASAVLERQIERYRMRHQGPILDRASQVFRRLTVGHYDRLQVGFDADDEASLRCIRSDGTEVGVEGLSEGARDQLYLALRLATLEHHGRTGDPMPLVLDDILIQFDEERARAALEVLGELAATRQILFFTHHGRLLDLARKAVSAERLSEHYLPGPRD